MRRIKVLKQVQKNFTSFTFVDDPRVIGKMVNKDAKVGDPKEGAQRPISKKKVEEISIHVQDGGTLATSVVLGTRLDKIQVIEDTSSGETEYYIELPESDAEFDEYKDTIDIMDGQHRVYSFLEETVKIPSSQRFDMTFSLYLDPTVEDKRRIFKDTNEKQDKVAANLILWIREKLGMLEEKEKVYLQLINMLSFENSSPFKDRIITSAEKIPGGIKAQQLVGEFDKIDFNDKMSAIKDNNQRFKILCIYFKGWEGAVGHKIIDRDKQFAAFSKISGIRFMLKLLPTILDRVDAVNGEWNEDFVKDTLNTVCAIEGIRPSDIFDTNSTYLKSLGFNPFASETQTKAFAKNWADKIKAIPRKHNPFANI